MMGHNAYRAPKITLESASVAGMCQTSTANAAAVSKPQVEENSPLFRKPPINSSRTAIGIAATKADSTIESSGSSGCGQIRASALLICVSQLGESYFEDTARSGTTPSERQRA